MSSDWLIPDHLAPVTSGVLGPFYDAVANDRLAMPLCAACALPLELEQLTCDRCAGEPIWRDVGLVGTVHACTTVHRREPGLVLATEPYQVLDVELSSGHRLVMTTISHDEHDYRVGEQVQIGFRHVGGVAVPAVAGTLGAP
jgi:uncharacterized OB-fold protein